MPKANESALRLKIAILDFDNLKNPLLNAGQARATFEVGKRLARRGHEIRVFCSRYPGSRDYAHEGVAYTHIGWGSKFIKLNNLAYIFAAPLALKNLEADIVVECFTTPMSVLFSPCYTKIPVAAKPTSFEAQRFSEKYFLPFYLAENFGSRHYKYFLPACPADEEKMRQLNPQIKCRLVPEGVDDGYFDIPREKPEYILYLGRFDISQKGLDLLIEAYAMVKDRVAWPLVLAGFGPDEDKLRRMVEEHGLGDRVKFAGPAYGEKKRRLFSRSLFLVLPSRREGFGLAALEAMAAGLPVACFDVPGLSWADETAAVKAGEMTAESLSAVLSGLSADLEQTIEQGRRAREFARQFSWDKVADEYERFFYEIVEGRV